LCRARRAFGSPAPPPEASIARFATRNRFEPRVDDRRAGRSARAHRGRVGATAHRTQEELWAAALGDEPGLIAEIVNFVAAARTRLAQPAALADAPPPVGKRAGSR
jgi:hypothetical protein